MSTSPFDRRRYAAAAVIVRRLERARRIQLELTTRSG
jgi:hypothetical protein